MVMTGATAAATAGAAVSALLAKLDALLLEGNCKSKEAIHITFLRDELQQTQHFFREFLESEHNPDGKSYWRRLRELSYEIEDTVDAITVKQQQQPSSGLLKSSHRSWRSFTSRILEFPNRVLFRLAMLDQLQELKSRLKELISELKDSQRDRLVKLLLEVDEKNNDPRRVLSILGYPGVGKTTLARQVFCKIQPYLDCVAWVSMSSYRSVTNILEDILCQVDDGVQVDRYVSGAIRESLAHKRYLVVVDGICNPYDYFAINMALPCNSLGSRCSMSSVEQLGNLSELRELTLWWSPETEVDNIDERCEQLAFSLYRLRKLQSLYINGCDDLQLLSELPSLFYLSLSSKYMATEKLFVTSNGFPVLQEFHLVFSQAEPDI
ncbi:hypothetical protein PR202_ga10996 [Eleusine coracana subsp. coracana]|uniref:Uncharacterized protein n=1 Tax=Eleusine coracana subsp. coracana TaxID=191504 RepID=A0AAV5C869_ELECO|nr:hypothetical protein PR202_ga10996 [Eleusine coracana subsp. coracana]